VVGVLAVAVPPLNEVLKARRGDCLPAQPWAAAEHTAKGLFCEVRPERPIVVLQTAPGSCTFR